MSRKHPSPKKTLIREIESITELIERQNSLRNTAIQGLNLSNVPIAWDTVDIQGTIFLGCTFACHDDESIVTQRGAYIFPRFEGLPYNPYRARLYTWQELMEGYDPQDDRSLDYRIY